MVMTSQTNNNMAAPARGGKNYYYRESKLITSHSDSDSEDAYEVPPEFDSDSTDSDSDKTSANSRTSDVRSKSFVEDSLPNDNTAMLSKPYPPARKSDSDSNLKGHLLQHGDKGKQTAMVQPTVHQPEIPKHALTRLADGRVNLGKVKWYHGPLSRHAAEGLLLACGDDGTYLLRDSSSDPNGFSLSVKCNNSVKHFQVSYEGGNYHFGLVTFPSLDQFLEHFDNQPLIGGEAGTIVVLKYPYYRDVSEPDIYETATVHTVVGPIESLDSDNTHNPIAIASKSGFLTKLGGRRKNWRRRWFTVFKNELQYYRRPNDKTPLRTINLEKALEVERHNSGPKENCFRLVCPERTFYMYASSKAESDDWIKIIQWKMAHNLQRQTTRLKPSACQ